MSHLDDPAENEEQASHLVGRTVVKAEIEEGENRALGLWLGLDDGSRLIVSGLVRGGVEITWQSPDEVFEFDREVMEEGGFDSSAPEP